MMKKMSSSYNSVLLILLVVLVQFINYPVTVSGECICEPEDEEGVDKSKALVLKIISIAVILTASAIGVCLPILGRRIPALHPDSNIFFVIKSFAAGVILATGFIHILPDAFGDLTSPCLKENPWGNFPFTGFVAMMSAILTLMADSLATGYYRRSELKKKFSHNGRDETKVGVTVGDDENEAGDKVEVHTHATHGHSHGSSLSSSADMLLRHKVITQVLELGILVHSVIIGVAVGVSQSPSTIRPLLGALTFHQFFEGIGLGGCITQAEFNAKYVVWMCAFFALTTPGGIAIGIGITNVYSETSPTALIVQGVMNAAAAGILIYMSLVDLLAAIFMDPKLQENGMLQLSSYVALLLGAGAMSVIAKWA
ncbi:zinc transporter 5-like [Papaver somniferum]|uniref:zinc transporter 5-like n=1 Tax=Papaver somniferum TaxID=3469 RepID=UPI000E704B65|nr:zinc transporter 5-like [Papaver somniferum]